MSFNWLLNKLRGRGDRQITRFPDEEVLQPRETDNTSRIRSQSSSSAATGEVSTTGRPRTRKKSAVDLPQVHEVRGVNVRHTQAIDVSFASSAIAVDPARGSKSKSFMAGSPGCSSPSAISTGRMFVALFDYNARTDQDLSFRRSEHLEVLDKTNEEWYLAKSHVTGLEGWIPANYVAKLQSIEAEEWYFGKIRRAEAERRLMSRDNVHGSFLIRESETRPNEYSLSVRCYETVRHYRIRPKDHGGFFISRKNQFSTLHDLVSFYNTDANGLCARLSVPCVKTEKPNPIGLSYNTLDMWEIPREQLKVTNRLGSGHFGEVFEGSWNHTVPVAIKTLKSGKMDSEEFLKEAQFLKKLRHPHLLQLYGVCTKEEPFFIVTELMEFGSLLAYVRGVRLPFDEQAYIGAQIAGGMEHLENNNYIHRDLAARNVLVGRNYIVKVADFGLSRLVKEDEYQAQEGSKFPIKWTAPEALGYCRFTTKSDVWSFGVLLMEIITHGMTPYPGMSNLEVVDQIEKGYRMPQPTGCPNKMYNIILETWAKNPMSRPTFETLRWKLEDYFISDDSDYKDADQVF